jgi:hypothetical protein
MTSYLRPDEKAAAVDIEKSKRQDAAIKSGFKTAASLASGAGAVGIGSKVLSPLSSKILPFINKYIPPEMAIKGINKISPELGNFLKKGMNQGLNVQDGLSFIKNEIEKNKEPAKQNKNIIEIESPELHSFILEKIKGGENPIQAGARAFNDKRFTQSINNLKNKYKTNWENIIKTVFGTGETAQPQEQQNALAEEAMNPAGSQPTAVLSAEAQAAKQQSNPQGKQQLLQAMQELSQKLRT